MPTRHLSILILLLLFLSGFGQVHLFEQNPGKQIFSTADSAYSATLAVLSLPDICKSIELPPIHDNSTSPYLRPVFQQLGASCGQASSVAYTFTYEIDRKRGLPANDSSNQYPTHFTWNFMNGGDGWYGVNYMHSFEIIKTLGTPSIADYGGVVV